MKSGNFYVTSLRAVYSIHSGRRFFECLCPNNISMFESFRQVRHKGIRERVKTFTRIGDDENITVTDTTILS